ncbi:hypothetical protein PsorP6_016476 [Peronosclerospora sorghi]|uniref:Uncharacterized protein n=1 Tax=Peronosclerospora sorghi TaxID=230839 RepID=A0ACC0VS50_9STRA|nr:hypothetical protein PsorP6_016476 [Peronosclerospora sorghi]
MAHDQSTRGLWDDKVIATKRLPREQVQVDESIGHENVGHVFAGVFNGGKVAIKTVRPDIQANDEKMRHLLTQVKLSVTLTHPHLVNLIGVAWTCVSDFCIVQEFMERGDLRSLLDIYKSQGRSSGFDRVKVQLARDICRALAYLHALSPPVVHGHLTSKHVLLTRGMEAKVANLSVSSTRGQPTLWMAPEVLRGETSSTDTDMFSFGVILSELDMLAPPYAQAKVQIRDATSRPLQDDAILDKVEKGSLRVVFSDAQPLALADLGRACVSLNPLMRPTASAALYKLETILAQEVA